MQASLVSYHVDVQTDCWQMRDKSMQSNTILVEDRFTQHAFPKHRSVQCDEVHVASVSSQVEADLAKRADAASQTSPTPTTTSSTSSSDAAWEPVPDRPAAWLEPPTASTTPLPSPSRVARNDHKREQRRRKRSREAAERRAAKQESPSTTEASTSQTSSEPWVISHEKLCLIFKTMQRYSNGMRYKWANYCRETGSANCDPTKHSIDDLFAFFDTLILTSERADALPCGAGTSKKALRSLARPLPSSVSRWRPSASSIAQCHTAT